MYRSNNDISRKAEKFNIHKYYSKIYMYITENKLQYDMHRLVEVKYRPLIYNALCVVTHTVIKKNYIVQKCYNK